ncbi:hypothetical protein ABEF95_016087 [Exophiala dermatitidis]
MPKPGFNESGRPLNAGAARGEINRIRRDRGIIDDYDESQIRKTDSSFQEDYRRRAAEHRALYARYTRTIAEQLYSSRFRLIYELLQNGDDSCHANAVEPSITFRIKPSALIIESNELGFTLENVESICDTGKSSKASNADTTGEKGLGFKSVFGIAEYVHIQSGLWSFRFEHRQGEEGVGMITPVWTDVTSLLPSNVGTRLALRYYDQRDIFSTRLVSEFEKLPRTIMFALRKLRKLVIVVDGVAGRSDRIAFEKDGDLRSDQIRINTTVTGNFGAHTSATTWLRLFQNTVSDLPSDTHRTSSESDVTVAFEVDSYGLPVIPANGQHVFAYLPVERIIQLPFLINANFILTANRESVPDTDWNNALREGVSSAFVGLVDKVVTSGDPLEFKWMRYIPQRPMQGFWEYLWVEIQNELVNRGTPILRSRRGELHSIEHMATIPDWFIHDNEPIVADTDEDIYLSDGYESSDVGILEDFGVAPISATEILERIKLGLSQGAEAPIYHIPLDDSWHTAFAALLQRLLGERSIKKDVERLRIIPLDDNRWVSPMSLHVDAVYLPYLVDEDSVSIEVPDGLGFKKLHETAAADGERAGFYTSLGITSCPPDAVTARILEMHQLRKRRGTLSTFKMDLEILFWFGEQPSPSTQSQIRMILVSNENEALRGPFLFFPSDDTYHAEKLLAATAKEDLQKCGYGILDKQYLKSQVSNHFRHGLDWISYLQRWGVRYFPDLVQQVSAGWKLHPLMELIARDNSDSFVANLKAHWSDYRVDASRIKNDLKNVMQEFAKRPWIRSKTVEEAWYRSTDCIWEGPSFLRVKQVLSPLYGANQSASSFFKTILNMRDVSYNDFIDELKMLSTDAKAGSHLIETEAPKVYAALDAMASSEPVIEAIRKEFNANGLIYVGQKWLKPSECLWNCTVAISGRQPLDQVYDGLKEFFVKKVKVKTMNINVLLQELGRTAERTSPDVDEVKRIILTVGELLASDPEVAVNEKQLRNLEKTTFLPVRGPNGLELFSVDQAFAINDHQRYGQLFANQAKILDFGHEKMTSLYTLFKLLNLEDRFLSGLVVPKTTVDKSTAHEALGHYIRDRAYALSCCANYYNSSVYYNRRTTMHGLLLAAEVFVCEEMWTELVLPEEYDSVTVQSDRAVVDIRSPDGKLTIYVPSDYDGLYSCFHTELPEALANVLFIDNERAVKVIYRILNDTKKDLDTIMKDEDLPEYPWFEKPAPWLRTVSFPVPGDTEPNSRSMPTPAWPPSAPSDHNNDDDDNDVIVTQVNQRSTAVTAPYPQLEIRIPSPLAVQFQSTVSDQTIWESVARDQQYKRLLREVIRQARRGGRLRQTTAGSGSLSLHEIDEALDELTHPTPADYAAFYRTFGDTGNGRFEENARVGAAGELYVFELLKAYGVTNFGIDHWQSSIRHYVNILPEYAAEPSWHGREISDIMYKGSCPRLMELLRENTRFPYPAWLRGPSRSTSTRTPVVNYHIEVKTTSGPCNTPFFMSSNQYRLMRDKACPNDSTTPPRDLYLIMRVFNLFSSRIGLQVYINPWHLRDTALEFVADPWKVVPQQPL